jgi:hypothetical protein
MGPTTPNSNQEIGNTAADSGPDIFVVWFEHHPLSSFVDGFLQKDEESTDVNVLPLTIAGHRARPPQPDTAASAAEIPDAVDLPWV